MAVYFSLVKLPPRVQSNIDHMQLVLLCGEKNFQEFSHAKLLAVLKVLEENGITMADKSVVKRTLYGIAGDRNY